MNILITGCRGQLGSELLYLQTIYTHSHTFFNTDREELDITSQKEVNSFIRDKQIDLIINCAAYTAVDQAEENREKAYQLNSLAPSFLAQAIERQGGAFIHISTDYVFDGTTCKPYLENDIANPKTVYGMTKREGEKAVLNLCQQAMIIRTAWLYSSFGENFVKTMIRLGEERKELSVISDQIGTPTYAADLAVVIWEIINKGIIPGIYHYTNEGVTSWFDFAATIHKLVGISSCKLSPLPTEHYPQRTPRPYYSVLNKQKIKNTYRITIPWWEESLEKCIEKILYKS